MQKLALALAFLLGLVTLVASQAPPPVPALPDAPRITSYSIAASTCACSVGFAIYGDGTAGARIVEILVNGPAPAAPTSRPDGHGQPVQPVLAAGAPV